MPAASSPTPSSASAPCARAICFAFQIALQDSGAGAVMCSYNKINGTYGCENSYTLTDVLKKDFGFKGFVVSDWGATQSTIKAANAGLDIEMPGARLVRRTAQESSAKRRSFHAGSTTWSTAYSAPNLIQASSTILRNRNPQT